MDHYTLSERSKIVEFYIKNHFSIIKTQREFCRILKRRTAPARKTITGLYEKFTSTGDLGNKKHFQRIKPKRSDEIIERVRESIRENPSASIRARSSELNITKSTLRRIISQIHGKCERTTVYLSVENHQNTSQNSQSSGQNAASNDTETEYDEGDHT